MLDEKTIKEIKEKTKGMRTLEEWREAVKDLYETYGKEALYYVDCSFFDTEEMKTEPSPFEEFDKEEVSHYGIIVKYSVYEKRTKKCFPCNYGMVYLIG